MAYTTIKKPSDYFNTKLYTGNGSASRSITGVGFQPDWVWVKSRSATYYHALWDVVRTNKSALYSNTTDAEDTGTGGTLGSFNSDGFTLPNESGGFVNNNGTTYASWNWLGANGTAANTDGDIASTVSANTTSGFSIVSYTGTGANATVGHGLGSAPKMIIVKKTNTTANWGVYHASSGNTKYQLLNGNYADTIESTAWNNTSPTSSVFSVGSWNESNASGSTYIAYCFAEKQGYSKFGSYLGNGNVNGTFVYTGFKPAFVIRKRTSSTGKWIVQDSKRPSSQPFNEKRGELYANDSAAESSSQYYIMDFLSNGFKNRSVDGEVNGSGSSYIYMAFAEQPLVGDNPATAR